MDRLRRPLGDRAVHVCVDVQGLFSPAGPWAVPALEQILPQVAHIAGTLPERTIFTRFIPPARADDLPGMWRWYYRRWSEVTRENLDPALLDLAPPLRSAAARAEVVDKTVYSPFVGGRIAESLRARGADTLVITGLETDVCVLATVLSAVDLGYRVVIVEDAICSSSEVGHDAVLTLYRTRFAEQIELADTPAILESWGFQQADSAIFAAR